MTITELLKIKERNEAQQEFYEKINITLEPIKTVSKPLVSPYEENTKQFARVIGIAYKIAIIISVANLNPNLNIRSALATDPYLTEENLMISNRYFEDHPTKYLEENHYHKLFQKLVVPNTKHSIKEIVNASLYLAWHKLFLKSGYWPADLEVLNEENETHKKITNEVFKLLIKTASIIINNFLGKDVVINPSYSNLDLEVTDKADIFANNTLHVFTTSESTDSVNSNIKYLRGLIELNRLADKYHIDEAMVHYIRYNDTLVVI